MSGSRYYLVRSRVLVEGVRVSAVRAGGGCGVPYARFPVSTPRLFLEAAAATFARLHGLQGADPYLPV